MIVTGARARAGKYAFVLMLLGVFLAPGVLARGAGSFDDLTRFDPDSALKVDHSVWDAILAEYVEPGADGINRFAYGRVSRKDKQALEQYIQALEAIDPARYNKNEQFAFWANLYNAVTINLVIDAYPVTSIRKIKSGFFSSGPWTKKRIRLGGRALSLDDVEHKILRAHWRDPRVHYALNCASLGCPNLLPRALTDAGLDKTLDDAARAYINHPRGARIENGRLIVSSIYTWFRVDFGATDQGVIAHLMLYADEPLAQNLSHMTKISGHSYDWSLNDADGR